MIQGFPKPGFLVQALDGDPDDVGCSGEKGGVSLIEAAGVRTADLEHAEIAATLSTAFDPDAD